MRKLYHRLIRGNNLDYSQEIIQQTIPLYVKQTHTPKGRGVFAGRRIECGEVIEVCPVVPLVTPFDELPYELQCIVFDWEVLADTEYMLVLVLGYGSLYNHDNPANTRYRSDLNGETLIYSAARDIEQDEEITINYNDTQGETISDDDTWFRMNGIELYQKPSD